ncbi:sensor histidine kinase [Polaribacter sp. ALD11]|uniref:sensor histidine kinase n=1 Tax=Polaribacter sp. ALD11 TaxID=2058137 RepID=UPI0012FE77CB|nr:histidine kinase [Polaribacter sp. ALD11]
MILPILVFCAFSGAFIILNYSDSINRKNEKELLKNKKELQQAYLELEEAKKIELSNFQLKALKAQMNPHFLFNAINSIQNLILKDNKQEAYNYLTKFSSLMRDNLNTSEKSFVSFKKELSMLKKYLELEKLRFGALFTYQIIGTEKIENIEIPSMVIQPFIENSLRYSLLHKKEGSKKISIDFFQEDFLKCIIEDNGIGFEALKNIKNIHQSKVVTNSLNDNINKRLVLLKELYNIEIDYTYEDVIEGTRVILKIPFTK